MKLSFGLNFWLGTLLILAWPILIWAALRPQPWIDLTLESKYDFSSDPLTTEKVWSLDPKQLNPHLQRWVVQRQVQLLGLKAIQRNPKDKVFGVEATGLISDATAYVRPAGP